MSISCVYRYVSRFMCFGIALDNGINTLYFLHSENWHLLSVITICLVCIILNGVLYYQGAESALRNTWEDLQQIKKNTYWPYLISLVSAFVMASFTLHNYSEGSIHLPKVLSYLFTACYFVGTHTLIIQATKSKISINVMSMPGKQQKLFFLWFVLFMLATAAAIPQWAAGIDWLWHNNLLTNIAASLTYLGEAYFVARLSIWLSKQKLIKFKQPICLFIIIAASLNALGFAAMTEFDSWLTVNLSTHATFSLGFILSFFMMLKSLYIWQADAKLSKPTFLLTHHQALSQNHP